MNDLYNRYIQEKLTDPKLKEIPFSKWKEQNIKNMKVPKKR
jgi:hypothetical protein